MTRALGVLGLVVAALVAWALRLDPQEWRTFARATHEDGALFTGLVWSGYEGRVHETRWKGFLAGLAVGDAEAVQVARRVCPRLDAHPAEEFLEALWENVTARPAVMFSVIEGCMSVRLLCDVGGDARALGPLRGLLDGGWAPQARECLGWLVPSSPLSPTLSPSGEREAREVREARDSGVEPGLELGPRGP